MASTEPSPTSTSWTLRFKNHKTTVLLHVQSTQSIDSIKHLLVDALDKAGYNIVSGVPIPATINRIELAVPRDNNDLSKGWVPLKLKSPNGESNVGRQKGSKRGSDVLNSTPVTAGLKDGLVIAFRFMAEEDGNVEEGDENDEEEAEESDEDMEVDAEKNDDWDVVLPSYVEDAG